jgi:hypothetical protein
MKMMEGTPILRREVELKIKGMGPVGQSCIGRLRQVLECIKKS